MLRNQAKSSNDSKEASRSNKDLSELFRNKSSIGDFVVNHELKSKSELGLEEALKKTNREVRKQAWAPPQERILWSESSRLCCEPSHTIPSRCLCDVSDNSAHRAQVKVGILNVILAFNLIIIIGLYFL